MAEIIRRVVWKYPLLNKIVEIPKGAELLTVAVQEDTVCLWALVDPEQPKVKRKIALIGTGTHGVFPGEKYIGTCHMENGEFVVHAFNCGEIE
jgi:hypothetical protein